MILADTDVLIDFLAGVEPMASRMASYLEQDQLQTTAINAFELLSGAREGNRGDRVRRLVAALPVLVLDREAAAHAARVRQQLEGTGNTIGMADSLIAGIALVHGLPFWTRNQKHFERVDGLRLVEGA